ncbi:tRNA glutamyl-Q(34) synthetase GluQRS [Sulfitobacter mediterraneus]|uniref:Glutamyl-Q tRNA(Asp) synthetase n=1 Tax=Sulfitobacter mediterraneus TaxID=83219 RepID=A0A2T6CHA7_9RHOB|nr:tRNA glutamyl-Q(34) synthetase GluQRS [Sulfitobacter mediterraneus]KIN77223.1 tRNA synthetase class I (E and Q), catalytic domain [Sulfitobacter mediterraneus KCTC 32188]PTX74887.1 glutamyl-Q tRNA(Asp) synthetase [Sulfitobacter mediterraneus]
MFRTRFAPSPTGPLHLGHAYSALIAHDMAVRQQGELLLRIEDIDQSRARAEWERQIYDDLHWLGLTWPEPVMRQSKRLQIYKDTLQTLWDRKLIYACRCSRKDIAAAASAPQEGADPLIGPDGVVYPGTCRPNAIKNRLGVPPTDAALRLDMARAVASHETFSFQETGQGPQGEHGRITFTPDQMVHEIGDIVLARRDMGTSYHLSVVLDDAAQEITDVVRGQDLFEATKIHIVLQTLLNLPHPTYHHHDLIRDEHGKRLAKRDDARAISLYRAEGRSPKEIRNMVMP